MTHGDNLLPGDFGYKIAQGGHPEPAGDRRGARRAPRHPLRASRGASRGRARESRRRRPSAPRKTLLAMAGDSFFRWGNDAFVMGHIHYPCIERFGERTFVILGDWERNFSYLEMREGRLSLGFYRPAEKTLIENR